MDCNEDDDLMDNDGLMDNDLMDNDDDSSDGESERGQPDDEEDGHSDNGLWGIQQVVVDGKEPVGMNIHYNQTDQACDTSVMQSCIASTSSLIPSGAHTRTTSSASMSSAISHLQAPHRSCNLVESQ